MTRSPNFYVHCPSRTDPTAAPPGCDSVMVLLPVANIQQVRQGLAQAARPCTGNEPGRVCMGGNAASGASNATEPARKDAPELECVCPFPGCAQMLDDKSKQVPWWQKITGKTPAPRLTEESGEERKGGAVPAVACGAP